MSSSKLSGVRALMVDLAGTVHVGSDALPGAVAAVAALRGAGVPFKFVTNTSKESQRLLHSRLTGIGFKVEDREIFSCLTAARKLVDRRGLRPMLLVEDEAMEDFSGVNTTPPLDSVVVGLAPSKFGYDSLTEAFRLIHGGASLIAIHKSRYFKAEDGLVLGPGCFVAGLEYSTGASAEVVGKPEPAFFEAAWEQLKEETGMTDLKREDTLMVGDDVRVDVLGAQEAGFQGCLVQTGKYVSGDETRFGGSPDHVSASFADLVEELLLSRN